jgi:hypothetical protein
MISADRLLELGHVENRMYGGVSRQLKPVSHESDTLHDAKRVEEAKRQFLMRSRRQRTLDVGLQLKKNQIASFKAAFRAVLIRLFLHAVFGTMQVMLQELIHPLTVRGLVKHLRMRGHSRVHC